MRFFLTFLWVSLTLSCGGRRVYLGNDSGSMSDASHPALEDASSSSSDADAKPVPTPAVDAALDGSNPSGMACTATPIEELFPGTSLNPRWSEIWGTSPTYTVENSLLRITDASFAPTPSTSDPDDSWIYDLKQDRGNQIVWPLSIGTKNFDVQVKSQWASSEGELTLAGVALIALDGATKSNYAIQAIAGVYDGSANLSGRFFARVLNSAGQVVEYFNTNLSLSGAPTFRLVRTNGTMKVYYLPEASSPPAEVIAVSNTSSIRGIAIVSVHYREINGTVHPFGDFILESIRVSCP